MIWLYQSLNQFDKLVWLTAKPRRLILFLILLCNFFPSWKSFPLITTDQQTNKVCLKSTQVQLHPILYTGCEFLKQWFKNELFFFFSQSEIVLLFISKNFQGEALRTEPPPPFFFITPPSHFVFWFTVDACEFFLRCSGCREAAYVTWKWDTLFKR